MVCNALDVSLLSYKDHRAPALIHPGSNKTGVRNGDAKSSPSKANVFSLIVHLSADSKRSFTKSKNSNTYTTSWMSTGGRKSGLNQNEWSQTPAAPKKWSQATARLMRKHNSRTELEASINNRRVRAYTARLSFQLFSSTENYYHRLTARTAPALSLPLAGDKPSSARGGVSSD